MYRSSVERIEQSPLVLLREVEQVELDHRHPVEQRGVEPAWCLLMTSDLAEFGGLGPHLIRHLGEALLEPAAPLTVDLRVAGGCERLELGHDVGRWMKPGRDKASRGSARDVRRVRSLACARIGRYDDAQIHYGHAQTSLCRSATRSAERAPTPTSKARIDR